MRVLVACEYSGRVRDAFMARGHQAVSCDLLWLKGLPPLTPTTVVAGRKATILGMAPGPDRWRERSRTYMGLAEAMADQWGGWQ